jgi:pimeloyl-ACP methyl ester carboxylesterase
MLALPIGVTLPVAMQGDPRGVPVVLLHGLSDSWRAFESLLGHLPEHIRAIAITQRGHGDATRPANGYRARDFAGDLAACLDALGIDAAFIVGASSAGLTAQRFALDHPTRVLGLVFAGAPPTLRGNPLVQAAWDATIAHLTDPVDPAFVRAFQAGTVERPLPPEQFELFVAEALKLPARVWKETVAGLMADDFTADLGAISAPTLVIWGDRDTILDRAGQQAFVAAIPRARLVVYPGAGHAFYWEEPARFAADLEAFTLAIVEPGSRRA